MCIEHAVLCKCGKGSASFNFKDDIMPSEIIRGLYCPECSTGIDLDRSSMISDNGWVIDYDMDVAELYAARLPEKDAMIKTPEMIFDGGYATWRGIYPGDHIDSARERGELMELSKTDPKRYIDAMRTWGNSRMEDLRKKGWRKADEKAGERSGRAHGPV